MTENQHAKGVDLAKWLWPMIDTDSSSDIRLLAMGETLTYDSPIGVCPGNPSLRGEGAAGRCETAGSKKPEAYSLEYVEDFFGPRTTQIPADRLPK